MSLYPLISFATESRYRVEKSGDYLSLEEIKQFRQPNSRTPGHPEVDLNP